LPAWAAPAGRHTPAGSSFRPQFVACQPAVTVPIEPSQGVRCLIDFLWRNHTVAVGIERLNQRRPPPPAVPFSALLW